MTKPAIEAIAQRVIVHAENLVNEDLLQPAAVLEGVLQGTARYAAFWQMKADGGVFDIAKWNALCQGFAVAGVTFLQEKCPELFVAPLGDCGPGEDVLDEPVPVPRPAKGRRI